MSQSAKDVESTHAAHQTISSKILRGLLSSDCGTTNCIAPHLQDDKDFKTLNT